MPKNAAQRVRERSKQVISSLLGESVAQSLTNLVNMRRRSTRVMWISHQPKSFRVRCLFRNEGVESLRPCKDHQDPKDLLCLLVIKSVFLQRHRRQAQRNKNAWIKCGEKSTLTGMLMVSYCSTPSQSRKSFSRRLAALETCSRVGRQKVERKKRNPHQNKIDVALPLCM